MSIKTDTITSQFADMTVMEYRGRVFGRKVSTEEVSVDNEGTVRAWDSVAEHWTTCHSITDRGIRAIRRAAGK